VEPESDLMLRRLAENEAIFRDANEQIEAARRELALERGRTPFLCECSEPACREVIRLTAAEYEFVRSKPGQFVVAPGHCDSAAHVVRDGGGAFVVVEKEGPALEVAIETDPRAGVDE
jgi:hypothetical protein